jgi:hypothetical protein
MSRQYILASGFLSGIGDKRLSFEAVEVFSAASTLLLINPLRVGLVCAASNQGATGAGSAPGAGKARRTTRRARLRPKEVFPGSEASTRDKPVSFPNTALGVSRPPWCPVPSQKLLE